MTWFERQAPEGEDVIKDVPIAKRSSAPFASCLLAISVKQTSRITLKPSETKDTMKLLLWNCETKFKSHFQSDNEPAAWRRLHYSAGWSCAKQLYYGGTREKFHPIISSVHVRVVLSFLLNLQSVTYCTWPSPLTNSYYFSTFRESRTKASEW